MQRPYRSGFLLCLALSAVARSQTCPGTGLALGVEGRRLGDAFEIRVQGTPGTLGPGILGLDLSGGPVSTPVGTVCLGLTPAFGFVPIAFDALGTSSVAGVLPPDPALAGASIHLQAAAERLPSAGGGFVLSNSYIARPRPPRILVYNPGLVTPFGTQPGSFCIVDALSETVGPAVPMTTSISDAILLPRLDVLLLLLGTNVLAAYDANLGTPLWNLPLPAGYATRVVADDEDDRVAVLSPGVAPTPFGPGAPGSLLVLDTQGTQLAQLSLPAGFLPDRIAMASSGPGSAAVALVSGTTIVTVDLFGSPSGGPLVRPAQSLAPGSNGIADWLVQGSAVYYVLTGTPPLFNAFDTATQTLLLQNPLVLPLAAAATKLRFGQGSQGPAFFILCPTGPVMGELQASTLTLINGTLIPAGIATFESSPGGTEWLLLCNGSGCVTPSLVRMDATTLAVSTVTTLPTPIQTLLPTLPSAVLRKGFLLYGSNVLARFGTDPAVPPSAALNLPVTSSALRVVVD
jgi:hypothetical protein